MAKKNTYSEAVKELTKIGNSDDWKDWLTHIQNDMISRGYCQVLTDKGSAEFAVRFSTLQQFFTDIRE